MGQYIFRFVVAGLCILVAVLFGKGLARGNMVLITGVVMWAPILLLCLNMEILLAITIACFASGLQVPGLSNNLMLSQVLGLIMSALVFVRILMNRGYRSQSGGGYRFALVALGIVILVTMYFRGSGFSVLGDSRWGGMRYISMLIGIAMVLVTPYLSISAKRLRTTLIIMCVLALLPVFSELLIMVLGDKVSLIGLFIRNARLSDLSDYGSMDRARIYAGNMAAPIIVLLPFIARSPSKKNTLLMGLCIFVSYSFAMVSGHRLSLMAVTLFLLAYAWFSEKISKTYLIFVSAFGVLWGYIVLVLTVEHLPFAIQRAVSWVPFIKVSSRAAIDAHNTIIWRIAVWKDAMSEVSEYFILGKGYTFDPMQVRSLILYGHYTRDWAIVTSAYHNGHLSLIIGLGIVGYIAGISSLILILKRHFNLARNTWTNSNLKKLHQVLFIRLTIMILFFMVVYGDAYVSLPPILFMTMILDLISQADMQKSNNNINSDVDSLLAKDPVVR